MCVVAGVEHSAVPEWGGVAVFVVVVDFSARLRSWVHSVGVRIHNILGQSHPTNTNITRTMGSMFDVALIIIRLLCVISSHLFYYNANK